MATNQMLAIRLHPPQGSRDVRLESVPIPQIEHPDDVVVKVTLAGLCGSDLHAYRGLEAFSEPYIMGHEFIGEVVALGSSYTHHQSSNTGSSPLGSEKTLERPELYRTLKIGDRVLSPFTTSCGECEPCHQGFTSRCIHSTLFGSPRLAGGQAQYVRVPKAGGTLFLAPSLYTLQTSQSATKTESGSKTEVKIADASLLLLGDILPTGYFAALQALRHQNLGPLLEGVPFMSSVGPNAKSTSSEERALKIAVVGLGPVGICALISLLDILERRQAVTSSSPQRVDIVAIDLNAERRAKAERILKQVQTGSSERIKVLVTDLDGAKARFEGGCHAVLEVVGSNSALRLAYDLIRPFSVISSVGVHTNPVFPLTGDELYSKNVSLSFGRCPVRALFSEALDLLARRQDVFGNIGEDGLVEQVVGFTDEEVKKAYDDFERGVVGKTLFDPWKPDGQVGVKRELNE